MNTWNALPKPYRHRVNGNTLAAVKQRIFAADTTVPTVPVSTEAAQVDTQLLEEFLESTPPLEEPNIGSRNDNGEMPGDIDAYEGFVPFDDGESFDFAGEGRASVPHAEPEDEDDIRHMSRRCRGSNHPAADEGDEHDWMNSDVELHGSEGGHDNQYEDATQGEEHLQA